MFLGSVGAVVGTALCTAAINGVTSHSRLYVMTTNAMMFIAGRLLLGIGGVVVGAIGPVNTPLGQRLKL
jgi:hypothetical protein